MNTHTDSPIRLVAELMSRSRALRKSFRRPYLRVNRWLWTHLPERCRSSSIMRPYGDHLLQLIQLQSARTQNIGTFFFRNRPELELLTRLLNSQKRGSTVRLTVLGCSKGAEVYSFLYSIRHARPDLGVSLSAMDIDPDVVTFAKEGIYSLHSRVCGESSGPSCGIKSGDLVVKTFAGQTKSVFERMSSDQIDAMFEREGEQARVRPQFRSGITWHVGDAGDLSVLDKFGLQDIVVANRFLCHMRPAQAERCLRNLARLVKPGGYLFVSGIDLTVRTKVARDLGWQPVTELIEEIHEGDPSLRNDWPLQYWGLEPFDRRRSEWQIRYASVFKIGEESLEHNTPAENREQQCVHIIEQRLTPVRFLESQANTCD